MTSSSPQVQIAIAVVEHDNRFLVGQRQHGALAGCAEFPGGKIEPGETPADAAVRECLEETGLAVEFVREYLRVAHTYDYGEVLLHFVACQLVTLRVDDVRPLKAPFRWVPRNELAQNSFPPANRRLLELLINERKPQGGDLAGEGS